MNKVKLLFPLILLPFLALSQQFYFSNENFEFASIPEQSGKTDFTDAETIYGLIVFEKEPKGQTRTYFETETFKVGRLKFMVSAKKTALINKPTKATLVQKGNTWFAYFTIRPVNKNNYDESTRDWRDYFVKLPKGKFEIVLLSEHKDFKKTSISLEITKPEVKETVYQNYLEAGNTATEYYNGIIRKEKAKKYEEETTMAFFDPLFSRYKKFEPKDKEISASNIAKIIEEKVGSTVSIVKIAIQDNTTDWIVYTHNKTGNITKKQTPEIVVIYKNETTGWCHYTALSFIKQHEGGGNYGEKFLTKKFHSPGRFNCDK